MEKKGEYTFANYIDSEFRRGYHLEYDREKFELRKEKIYTFFKIPTEVEKLIIFGFFHCVDSFLFVITFLPIRFVVALAKFFYTYFYLYFRKEYAQQPFLRNMETIDLIKGFLIIACCFAGTCVDTSMLYHLIKTQSAVKLYIFYNMLEIADKLMAAFGQDTLDALFWTATAPKARKRDYLLLTFHLLISFIYISIHALIVLLQSLVLNVAVNSESRGLLTIVISNNFIEIKGSVFKKYDRNNLLQITCADVRERFHHGVLLFVVIMLTMKEYSWKEDRLSNMLSICGTIFVVEMFIDWLKHAFITRFNEIPVDVYRDYVLLIASDLVMCKKQNAFSDHSDLVARRMGFTPLPLGVIVFRILSQTLKFNNLFSFFLLFVGFLCLFTFRILISILILATASWYIGPASSTRTTSSNRTTSESEQCGKGSVWRNAVDSYCERVHTPLRSRHRTASCREELTETLGATVTDVTSVVESDEWRPDAVATTPEFGRSAATLACGLGESRAALRANSMLNLVDVGMDVSEDTTCSQCSDSHDEHPVSDGIIVGPADDLTLLLTAITGDNGINADKDTALVPEHSANHSSSESTELPVVETFDNASAQPSDVIESDILPILRKGILVADTAHVNSIEINSSTNHY